MFHHFHGGIHAASQGSIAADDLAELVAYVGRERIVQPEDWIARSASGDLGEADLCLTFDDAPRSQYDVAVPVLRGLRLRAFFFVPTSHLDGEVPRLELYRWFRTTRFGSAAEFADAFERHLAHGPFAERARGALTTFDPRGYLPQFPFYDDADRRYRFLRDEVLGPDDHARAMDAMIAAAGVDAASAARSLLMGADEIRALVSEGHAIGLHSHSHPTRLAALPEREQERELARNHEILAGLTGRAPTAIAHPNGSYGDETLRILERLGITVGFRSSMTAVDPRVPMLEQPREDHVHVMALMRSGTAS